MVSLRRISSVARRILLVYRDTHTALGKDPGGAPAAYDYLNRVFRRIHLRAAGPLRPHYTWGVLHGAFLAKNLGYQRISVAEFGVAGGQGLICLENAAAFIEQALELTIDVYGFDTGVGLPAPVDWRDLPQHFSEGGYPMDQTALEARLQKAQLMIGPIQTTLPALLAASPAPFAFIAVDVDLYSSTVPVLGLLKQSPTLLLPRIHCYFDDVTGYSYGEFNGERLAIREFNDTSGSRKISPLFGLRHYVPKSQRDALWVEKIFMAHILDHPLYGAQDGLVRSSRADLR
jgi:hypothetical protein